MNAIAQKLNPAFRHALAGLLVSIGMAAAASTIFSSAPMLAQTEATPPTVVAASVPSLIRFSGTLVDASGWPIATPVAVTFSIYAQPSGDDKSALWQETQQISPNSKGGYT